MKLSVVLLALTATNTAAQQARCRVNGQYQAEPMIFRCEGARLGYQGSASFNSFDMLVAAGSTSTVVDIPPGTRDFTISMGASSSKLETAAKLFVENPATGEFVSLQEAQLPSGYDGVATLQRGFLSHEGKPMISANESSQDLRIKLWERLMLPRTQQLSMHGATPVPLRLVAKNLADEDIVLQFKKYSYAAYESGPQCEYEGIAPGCGAWDASLARQAVVEFCSKVKEDHPNSTDGWEALSVAGHLDAEHGLGAESFPSYMWCRVWAKYSQRPDYCWKAYKYITHGGFEQGIQEVTQKDIEFCYKLPELDTFGEECCETLVKDYRDAQTAYRAQAEMGHGGPGGLPDGLFQICTQTLPGTPEEFLDLYLDADGYQGFLEHDLDYCWNGFRLPEPDDISIDSSAPASAPAPAVSTQDSDIVAAQVAGDVPQDEPVVLATPAPATVQVTFLPDPASDAATVPILDAADQVPDATPAPAVRLYDKAQSLRAASTQQTTLLPFIFGLAACGGAVLMVAAVLRWRSAEEHRHYQTAPLGEPDDLLLAAE